MATHSPNREVDRPLLADVCRPRMPFAGNTSIRGRWPERKIHEPMVADDLHIHGLDSVGDVDTSIQREVPLRKLQLNHNATAL